MSANWRTYVRNEALRIEGDLTELPSALQQAPETQRARDALERARGALAPRHTRAALQAWWSGEDIETAWASLHAAAQSLVMVQPEARLRARLPEIASLAERGLPRRDVRQATYRSWLATEAQATTPLDRVRLREVLRNVQGTSDVAHINVRGFRNLLVWITAVIAVVLVVFAVVHAIDTRFVSLCAPGESGCRPSRTGVLEVELVGALGGLLAAVIGVGRLNRFEDPYGLPLVQALLKTASGAGTALFGVLLVQGAVLGIFTPQPSGRLVPYAALFGFAQDAITRFADRHADQVLGNAATAQTGSTDGADGTGGPAGEAPG